MIQRILHDPVDEKQAKQCEDGQYGLQRYKEGSEYKQIDDVDILVAHLKLQLLIELIDLKLMLAQLIRRHQLVQRIHIAQVVRRVDYLRQGVDHRVGDA